MNIWKVIANEGYNNAYLIDSSGKQRFDTVVSDRNTGKIITDKSTSFANKGGQKYDKIKI
jgi:hypothetical protein